MSNVLQFPVRLREIPTVAMVAIYFDQDRIFVFPSEQLSAVLGFVNADDAYPTCFITFNGAVVVPPSLAGARVLCVQVAVVTKVGLYMGSLNPISAERWNDGDVFRMPPMQFLVEPKQL